jgi:hypothetical protein
LDEESARYEASGREEEGFLFHSLLTSCLHLLLTKNQFIRTESKGSFTGSKILSRGVGEKCNLEGD